MKKYTILLFVICPSFLLAQKKVGVGTIVPEQRLSVDSTLVIDQGNFDDGSKPALRFGSGSGEAVGSRRATGGSNPFGLDFWTGFNKRMVLTNAGNFGIGTDTPSVALAVNGDVLVDYHSTNNGVSGKSLRFGNANSGEGISSARSGAINLNGLNFFTNFSSRMSITSTGKVGIGTTDPLNIFHVSSGNDPYVGYLSSDNVLSSFTVINTTAPSSNFGFLFSRGNAVKGYTFMNSSNNLVLSASTSGTEHLTITPAGNIGVSNNSPGFPLNFPASTGEKISLYGNSGNNYGLGIALNALQIHTDASSADILFGYGSSASFNETMRIKGNGNLNIKGDLVVDANGTNNATFSPAIRFGTATSGEAIASRRTPGGNQNGIDFYTNSINRMVITNSGQINIPGTISVGQIGVNTYTPTSMLEVRNGGLGISSSSKLWELNYDNTNNYFYIDEFGAGRRFTIKNGGNVGINTLAPSEKLEVVGNGKFSGDLTVQSGKGIIRNYSSAQLKTETFTYTFPGLVTLGAGNTTNLSVNFPEAYSSAPMVYVAGLLPSAGSGGYVECVYNITGITTTGFTLNIFNPRGTGAVFNNGSPNFMLNMVAVGVQ